MVELGRIDLTTPTVLHQDELALMIRTHDGVNDEDFFASGDGDFLEFARGKRHGTYDDRLRKMSTAPPSSVVRRPSSDHHSSPPRRHLKMPLCMT